LSHAQDVTDTEKQQRLDAALDKLRPATAAIISEHPEQA